MDFDTRQHRRRVILDRIVLAAQILAVVYLATHALIAWQAWQSDGVIASLLTLILLGFGDLYWGMRWSYEGDAPWLGGVALAAAAVCFTSWTMRGIFNRWMSGFAVEMLEDFGEEVGRITKDREVEDAVEVQPGEDGKDAAQDPGETRPRE